MSVTNSIDRNVIEAIQTMQDEYLDKVEEEHGKVMRLAVTLSAKSLAMLETVPAAINMSETRDQLHSLLEPIIGSYFAMTLAIVSDIAEFDDEKRAIMRGLGEHLVSSLNDKVQEILGEAGSGHKPIINLSH